MESIDKLTLYKDEQAVCGRLLGLTGEIEILHLACHGEYDQSDPLLSRLYLTDGPVYAYEL